MVQPGSRAVFQEAAQRPLLVVFQAALQFKGSTEETEQVTTLPCLKPGEPYPFGSGGIMETAVQRFQVFEPRQQPDRPPLLDLPKHTGIFNTACHVTVDGKC
jgi:hypothetical protein